MSNEKISGRFFDDREIRAILGRKKSKGVFQFAVLHFLR